MTNPLNGELLQTFLPLYDVIPEKWEDARPFLIETLKRISYAVNVREVGSFLDQEVVTGMQFIPGVNDSPSTVPSEYRDVLRMVVPLPPLPDSTSLPPVPHNIAYDSNFSLINLWLAASDPVGLTSFSVQYWSVAAGDIKISLDSENILVSTQSDYSNYTVNYAIIEYLQQV